MDALEGPSPISTNGQVTIPKAILATLGWQRGDQVMFEISDDDPETLRLLPAAVVWRRYRRGEATERLERMSQASPSRGADQDADKGQG